MAVIAICFLGGDPFEGISAGYHSLGLIPTSLRLVGISTARLSGLSGLSGLFGLSGLSDGPVCLVLWLNKTNQMNQKDQRD
jgi:hypothetical protein